MSAKLEEYDLYVEEMGLFDEVGISGASPSSRHNKLSLAGILVPRNTAEESVREIAEL